MRLNTADERDILEHLEECSSQFLPPLDSSVNLGEYAAKIRRHAVTFEVWEGERLIGLVAAYFNNERVSEGFITHACVLSGYVAMGIGSRLMQSVVNYGMDNGFSLIELQVHCDNQAAIALYHKFSFDIVQTLESDGKFVMIRKL